MTITWTNEKRKLSDLIPWERNPKTISKKHAKKLLEYWQRVGQFQTVAAGPDGSLYDGHQRLAVLQDALGPDYEIDVRVSSRALTEQEREELVIAAHAGTTGQWNWDDLANWDAESLIEWGFDDSALDDWRRDVGGLGALLGSVEEDDRDAEIDEGDKGSAIQKWNVQYGDLWKIGEHKLLCGDSTNRTDIERLVGVSKYCVLTDPPYNIGFNYNDMEDKLSEGDYSEFCAKWFDAVKDSVCIIFSPGPKNIRLYPIPRDTGYWLKRYASAGASAFNLRTIEPLLIYGKIGQKRNFDLFDYSSGFPEELRAAQRAALVDKAHPPAKPLALWNELLEMLPEEMPVIDCFSGNGTTFIACQNNKRLCYGIERDTSYCALILERLSIAFPELEIARE